jgi:hypothetical protein
VGRGLEGLGGGRVCSTGPQGSLSLSLDFSLSGEEREGWGADREEGRCRKGNT